MRDEADPVLRPNDAARPTEDVELPDDRYRGPLEDGDRPTESTVDSEAGLSGWATPEPDEVTEAERDGTALAADPVPADADDSYVSDPAAHPAVTEPDDVDTTDDEPDDLGLTDSDAADDLGPTDSDTADGDAGDDGRPVEFQPVDDAVPPAGDPTAADSAVADSTGDDSAVADSTVDDSGVDDTTTEGWTVSRPESDAEVVDGDELPANEAGVVDEATVVDEPGVVDDAGTYVVADRAAEQETERDDALRDDALPGDALPGDALRDDATDLDTDAENPATAAVPVTEATLVQPVEPVPVLAEPLPTEQVPTEVAGQPVGEATPSGDLKPGEADLAPVGALLDDSATQDLRDRWREVQLRFIDDPHGSAVEAQTLVGEAVDRFVSALQGQRDSLNSWSTDQGDDTEILRAAVRGYRDFLDRLLGTF